MGKCSYIVITYFIPSTILSMFGDEFKLAAMCLIILSIGKMFSAISGSVGTFLQMVGRQKIFQNILLVAALINIVLNSLLIPKYGIEGAAVASTASGVFWNLLMIIYIKKTFWFLHYLYPMVKKVNYPNLYIVGAPKSGTTSLYHYLDQHPDITIPDKEPRFL